MHYTRIIFNNNVNNIRKAKLFLALNTNVSYHSKLYCIRIRFSIIHLIINVLGIIDSTNFRRVNRYLLSGDCTFERIQRISRH